VVRRARRRAGAGVRPGLVHRRFVLCGRRGDFRRWAGDPRPAHARAHRRFGVTAGRRPGADRRHDPGARHDRAARPRRLPALAAQAHRAAHGHRGAAGPRAGAARSALDRARVPCPSGTAARPGAFRLEGAGRGRDFRARWSRSSTPTSTGHCGDLPNGACRPSWTTCGRRSADERRRGGVLLAARMRVLRGTAPPPCRRAVSRSARSTSGKTPTPPRACVRSRTGTRPCRR